MFGINTPELIIIAIVAVLVIGPQRLPEYVEKLKNLIREVRRMAAGARETIKDEAGVDLDEIDWKKLDPRQYDPRRIIRDALMDDEEAPAKPVSPSAPVAAGAASGMITDGVSPNGASPNGASPNGTGPHDTAMWGGPAGGPEPAKTFERLTAGERAPFDLEAT
ncbi:twin-arginine translocase TatA/TatE family subunit [Arthrobacter sp. A5]|uniref:twin-arginine translocase TatA/TatE family subunit n=1 Tax=Arthrobacter sp. A5 TaxID=576926 RepID=UPI003DA7EB0C